VDGGLRALPHTPVFDMETLDDISGMGELDGCPDRMQRQTTG